MLDLRASPSPPAHSRVSAVARVDSCIAGGDGEGSLQSGCARTRSAWVSKGERCA